MNAIADSPITPNPQNPLQTMNCGDVLDIRAIQKLIPHRYPFLFVDRIERIILGASAVGIKNVSLNEWFFQGHFPDHPVVPGVLIVEAMAQTAGALVMKTLQATGHIDPEVMSTVVYFMSVESAKFRKPVVPGDTLELHVCKEQSRDMIWKFKGKAFVRGMLMDEAVFTAMIVKPT
jgi:3-hydroxyacyl-[acyl-carrier-protein] dehydratase